MNRRIIRLILNLSIILIVIGFLFRIQHWPGARNMMCIGFSCLAFLYAPMFLVNKFKNEKDKTLRVLNLLGIFWLFSFSIGSILDLLDYEIGEPIKRIGDVVLIFLFIPLLCYVIYKNKRNRLKRISILFLSLTYLSLSLYAYVIADYKNKAFNEIVNQIIEIQYDEFDKANHLQPDFEKVRFDTLHSWDLGWAILDPIDISKSKNHEIELVKRFSPGQKALYFFWYLDAEVIYGGFIQFYLNDNRCYLPAIKRGLVLIGDQELLKLIRKVDNEFLKNIDVINKFRNNGELALLYEELNQFDEYDDEYYKIQDRTMEFIEFYVREHPEDFVNLK